MIIQDYMSVREAADAWGVTVRQVQKMCGEGKIPNAIRFGRSWAIPQDAEKPTRTGKLKPGRKPKTNGAEKESELTILYKFSLEITQPLELEELAVIAVFYLNKLFSCDAEYHRFTEDDAEEKNKIKYAIDKTGGIETWRSHDELQAWGNTHTSIVAGVDIGDDYYRLPAFDLANIIGTIRIPKEKAAALEESYQLVKTWGTICALVMDRARTFAWYIKSREEAEAMRREGYIPEVITKGPLTIQTSSGESFVDGKNLRLTATEQKVLFYLVGDEGRTFAAEHLYEKVWGSRMFENDNALKTAVSKLRRKLKNTGYTISSKRGEGYCFRQI